jgi:hypothetical protein
VSTKTGTRIDHFAWIVSPDNLDRYVEQLTGLLGVDLLRHPGSHAMGPDSRVRISFKDGLELIAPGGDSTPTAQKFAQALGHPGEGPLVLIMRVPSIQEASERIERAGFSIGPAVTEPDEQKRRAVLATWAGNVLDYIEHPVNVRLPRTVLVITTLEYTVEPKAYVDRVGRLDRASWLVEPENAEKYVKMLEALFDLRFERDTGAPKGAASYVSWDGGLEVLTPSPGAAESEFRDRLAAHGEGLYSVAFGVEDLAETVERVRALGCTPDEAVTRRDGATEATLTEFVGTKLIASEPALARRDVAIARA